MSGVDRERTAPGANGFTLVELMVALAIFSLVALTLLKLQGTVVRNSGDVATRAVAQIVVQNLAVELATDPRAPALGEEQGSVANGGQNWRWVRTTQATADPSLVRIDLRVTDNGGRPAAALTMARPVQ